MQLQIEHLQNLRVFNFYLKGLLDKKILLLSANNPQNPEFVRNIFTYCQGEHCLITPDLFSFKYTNNADTENIRLTIMAELEDFLDNKQDLTNIEGEKNIIKQAEAVADSYIRPTLNRDNGDIEILDFSENALILKFTGHCAGCPFAQNTLNNVIYKALKRFIPEIKEIRLAE